MNLKNDFLFFLCMFALICFIGLIIIGNKGIIDLNKLKVERYGYIQKNEEVIKENSALHMTIERLRNDLTIIEHVARQELGMVNKNDVVFKIKQNNKK